MAHNKNNKESSLVEKLVAINKVSKTIKGGKTFSFMALVVVGDKKGKANFGTGKAREVTGARHKAFQKAKRTLIKVPLKEGRTVHHSCQGRFGATRVMLRPAVPGTGIIASEAVRAVCECLGISDIVTKCFGSRNSLNVIQATFRAFGSLNSPKKVAERRGRHISEIIKKRNVILGPKNKGKKAPEVKKETKKVEAKPEGEKKVAKKETKKKVEKPKAEKKVKKEDSEKKSPKKESTNKKKK